MPDITHDQANAALAAALDKAAETGTAMNIAIVDTAGHLKAFVRMEGAWLGSIDIAIKKAVTAALFKGESGGLGEMSQPGGPLYGIELSNGGLITFPGGVPFGEGDAVIGAIGVSGSTVENDRAVALAGAASLQSVSH